MLHLLCLICYHVVTVGTKNLHYWLVESMNDPASDPIAFWTNGDDRNKCHILWLTVELLLVG
jgi:hypothetical protein